MMVIIRTLVNGTLYVLFIYVMLIGRYYVHKLLYGFTLYYVIVLV